MSETPKVTGLITAYNSGRFIYRSVDSFLTQTFTDFEVVVVDDGSTDGTGAVLDEYARRDPRVRVFHQENSGPAGAGNRGFAEARGEYVAILDHDDIAVPDRFAKQVAYLDSHPEVAVVGGGLTVIDVRERKRQTDHYPTEPSDMRRALYQGPAINHSSSMMRLDLIRRIGGYRLAFDYTVDVDLFLRIADHAELASIWDVVVYYRAHANQVTGRHSPVQLLMNEVALELARNRLRGTPDTVPPGIRVGLSTLDQLGLDPEQVKRLRQRFPNAAILDKSFISDPSD